MTSSGLQAGADGAIAVIGDMSIHAIPRLYRESQALLTGEQDQTLDLSGVNHADSAGFALLLEWKSWAQRAGHRLDIVNPPSTLLTVARLAGADGLMGWKDIPVKKGATP